MSGQTESVDVAARTSVRTIRFVDQAGPGDVVLLRFRDPAPRVAVLPQGEGPEPGGDTLQVVLVSPGEAEADLARRLEASAEVEPIGVKLRGMELLWRPGRAVLECEPEQADLLLLALAEFAHYEGELRRMEDEIARGWGELEQDKGLAFDVTSADLRRSDAVGERMAATLRRRMRLARMEAHLLAPDTRLTAAGQRLGEMLREKAQMEARAETVDGQIEVFEHIYEMSAQRMGEYRAARQSSILEWIIVVLLAAEALLMAVQAFHR
jgi:hypothetical protein